MSNQVIEADDQIGNLREQISDFNDLQKQVEDLRAQLANSNEQIRTLENSLEESNSQIASLEQEIAENKVTIASSESQQQPVVEVEQSSVEQPTKGVMPGPVFGEGMTIGTGTGAEPGSLGVGTFE